MPMACSTPKNFAKTEINVSYNLKRCQSNDQY